MSFLVVCIAVGFLLMVLPFVLGTEEDPADMAPSHASTRLPHS